MKKKEILISDKLIKLTTKGFFYAIIFIIAIHFFGKFGQSGNALGMKTYNYYLECPFGLHSHTFEGSSSIFGSIYSDNLSGEKIFQIIISIVDHPFLILTIGLGFTFIIYLIKKINIKVVK